MTFLHNLNLKVLGSMISSTHSVADPHLLDASGSGSCLSLRLDLDSTFHFDVDPDPSFQIKAKALKKCSSRLIFQTHHLNIDADPGPANHFDADPHPTFQFAADPDPQHCLLTV